MQNLSCGIDFGTTNTSAAIVKTDNVPHMVLVENEAISIPSAIFFQSKDNKALFGREAVENYMQGNTGRFMRSLKRVLGTYLMEAGTSVNRETMKFETILEYFLQNIKNKIDKSAGMNVENVVMGRPVHFRDNDLHGDVQAEEQLRKIASLVGFKNIEFQFEPIAAAFAHETKIREEKLACVVDIGGGTSDFSIIKIGHNLISKQDRRSDILASTGIRIGGNDFDKNFSIKSFMPEIGMGTTHGGKSKFDQELPVPTSQFFDLSEWSSINSLYNYKTLNFVKKILFTANSPEKYGRLLEIIEGEKGHTLLAAVEATKMNLTHQENVSMALSFLADKPTLSITRNEFEDSIKDNINKVSQVVEECVKQAQISTSDIGLVVLTGGSTEIPLVRDSLCAYFPAAEISQENKLSSVGLGLAYDSARKFGVSMGNTIPLKKLP